MNSSEFRKQAREKLSGKWGKVALVTLAYFVIILVLNFITNRFTETALAPIISLFELIITIPLAYGLVSVFIKIIDNEEVSSFDFLPIGFNNFSRSWKITLNILLKILLPIILLIVSIVILAIGSAGTFTAYMFNSPDFSQTSFSGVLLLGLCMYFVSIVMLIIWSYYYQLSQIIAIENPDITPKEAVENSRKYMTGNRWKLFCLELSFIGWAFLCIFTLGIGMLWLTPYIQVATIVFSRYVCGNNENTTKTTENIENTDNN